MHSSHDLTVRLGRIDLNLLVALDVLLQLRNVTKSAQKLGITQSAMSHSLRRLRDVFDDPLLVRGGSGMVPTPRAESLAAPLRAALAGLSKAIDSPPDFDPATSDRTYRLVSPDLFDALVFPKLLRLMAQRSPSVSLTVAPTFDNLVARLEMGELDVGIVPTLAGPDAAPMGAELAPDLRMRRLLHDSFKTFVRAGHPAVQERRVTAKAFAKLDHVLVSPSGEGEGIVDPVLAERGLTRRIAFRAPHFASAIAVVQETDFVLVAPGSLASRGERLGLVELPVALKLPKHAVNMVWHARFDADPGHVWLRDQLLEAVAELPGS